MQWESQDPHDVPAFRNVPPENMKTIILDGIWHGAETSQGEVFVRSIIEPPILHFDSLYLIESDTLIVLENWEKIPVKEGFRLYGRIKDYFLASGDYRWKVGSGDWKKINWQENLGVKGNSFWIDVNKDELYLGENPLSFRLRNIEGDEIREDIMIAYNPYDAYLTFLSPARDTFLMENKSLKVEVKYEASQGREACDLFILKPDTVLLYHEEYTDGSTKADSFKYTLSPMQEGGYILLAKFKDGIYTYESTRRVYWDCTPPEVTIEKEDTVFSSAVSGVMPVVFTATDNFDTLTLRVKNAEIRIYDSQWNLVKRISGRRPFYGREARIYWDFTDNSGDTVKASGVYYAVVEVVDDAGNAGADTLRFYLDNKPPSIAVVDIDTLYTSSDPYFYLRYLIDEDARFTLSLRNTQDTSVVYNTYGYALFDIDEDGVQDTGYIFQEDIEDGLFEVSIYLKDMVGNDTVYVLDTIRVDRTLPVVSDFFVHPLVVGEDGISHVTLKVSERNDIPENRGNVELRVYLDDSLIADALLNPDAQEISYSCDVDLNGKSYGRHRVKIEAEDRWGNVYATSREVIYRTFGTEIAFPHDGSKIPMGKIVIKGIASDPDEYNKVPFDGFYLYWRQYVEGPRGGYFPGPWQDSLFEVPSELGGDGNKGTVPVKFKDVLAVWNATGLKKILDKFDNSGKN